MFEVSQKDCKLKTITIVRKVFECEHNKDTNSNKRLKNDTDNWSCRQNKVTSSVIYVLPKKRYIVISNLTMGRQSKGNLNEGSPSKVISGKRNFFISN